MLKIGASDCILGKFMIHDLAEGVGGYNYYLYVERDGSWLIMRQKEDNTEIRYASVNDKSYANGWMDKATLDYDYICNLSW